jgi:hypothetical protein
MEKRGRIFSHRRRARRRERRARSRSQWDITYASRSHLAYIATQLLAGNPVDPNHVSELVQAFLTTGILAYFSHAFYNSC